MFGCQQRRYNFFCVCIPRIAAQTDKQLTLSSYVVLYVFGFSVRMYEIRNNMDLNDRCARKKKTLSHFDLNNYTYIYTQNIHTHKLIITNISIIITA